MSLVQSLQIHLLELLVESFDLLQILGVLIPLIRTSTKKDVIILKPFQKLRSNLKDTYFWYNLMLILQQMPFNFHQSLLSRNSICFMSSVSY